MKTLRSVPAFLFLILFFAGNVRAQSEKAEKKAAARTALNNSIKNRRYHFVARNAIPAGGANRTLNTPYTLTLLGDTLDADLPYFGRAYSADISGANAGIRFTSTDFTYSATPGKKESWEIVLSPKNQTSASRIYMNIGSDGYATISVQSTNRQTISFYGSVSPNKRQ